MNCCLVLYVFSVFFSLYLLLSNYHLQVICLIFAFFYIYAMHQFHSRKVRPSHTTPHTRGAIVMNIDVMQYRAAIGIFNNLRIISRFRNLFDDLSAYSLRISVALLVSRIIITVLLPLIFFEFMLLNLILIFLCSYDTKIASLSMAYYIYTA